MLTGKPLSAKDAQRVGLVDYLVGQSDWPQAVDRLRRELALATAAPLRGAKKLLDEFASRHKMLSTAYRWALQSGGTQATGTGIVAPQYRGGPTGRAHCFASDRVAAWSGPKTR